MTDTLTPNPPKSANIEPKPRRPRQLSSTQVMFAVILAVGLMLAVNFSSRILADRDLQAVQTKVLQDIDTLKREQARLIDRLNYVNSDAYVEAWARSEGKMIRAGEVLVLPIPSNTLQQTETITTSNVPVQTTLPEPEHWELWWALFFDSPPPDF
jgi:cell division protein FtsB